MALGLEVFGLGLWQVFGFRVLEFRVWGQSFRKYQNSDPAHVFEHVEGYCDVTVLSFWVNNRVANPKNMEKPNPTKVK